MLKFLSRKNSILGISEPKKAEFVDIFFNIYENIKFSFKEHVFFFFCFYPVGTWRDGRNYVASISVQRHYDVMCQLGMLQFRYM